MASVLPFTKTRRCDRTAMSTPVAPPIEPISILIHFPLRFDTMSNTPIFMYATRPCMVMVTLPASGFPVLGSFEPSASVMSMSTVVSFRSKS